MFRSLVISLMILFASFQGQSQRVGIGTVTPLARLAVDSAIMLDQSNSNSGTLGQGALLFGSNGLVGLAWDAVSPGGSRNGLSFFTGGFRRMLIDSAGRLGLNTSSPLQRFHVEGNAYISGNIGIGISNPLFDLHISNSARLGGYLGINADPTNFYRLLVNGDSYFQNSNVGINIAPSSTYSLYAAGAVRFTDDVRVDGILNPNNPLAIGNNTSLTAV